MRSLAATQIYKAPGKFTVMEYAYWPRPQQPLVGLVMGRYPDGQRATWLTEPGYVDRARAACDSSDPLPIPDYPLVFRGWVDEGPPSRWRTVLEHYSQALVLAIVGDDGPDDNLE